MFIQPIQPFYDLAGSSFLTLPSNLSLINLRQVLINSKDLILARNITSNNKIKVIFDNYNLQDINNILTEVFVNNQILSYSTNFFKVNKQIQQQFSPNQSLKSNLNLNLKPELDWQNYCKAFITKTLGLTKQINKPTNQQLDIIHNLLVNSFATTINQENNQNQHIKNQTKANYINRYFTLDITNPNMKSFIVESKEGNIVGSYSLTIIDKEVQLSAVAGRSSLDNSYKNGKKLPILSASIIYEFETNPFFAKCEDLTFSNSKKPVADFYNKLGIISNPNRQGLIIK